MRSSPTNKRFFSLCLGILLMAFFIAPANAAGGSDIAAGTALLTPAIGTSSVSAIGGSIDFSNASEGYVMCRYTGSSDKAAVRIEKRGSTKPYTYFLDTAKQEYEAFPITQKDGNYQITIWQHLYGNTYAQVVSTSVCVELASEFSPFLYPSRLIAFSEESACVAKARDLTDGMTNEAVKVQAVLNYITSSIAFDHEKAEGVESGYVSDPDRTVETGKGVCVDYAALGAAMLRSQGIPVKMVYGYSPEGEYHAWISVYSGNRWTRYDPARTAESKQPAPGNGYVVTYVY